jgi:hypothetical protein
LTVPANPFNGVTVNVALLLASAPAGTLRLLILERTKAGALVTLIGNLSVVVTVDEVAEVAVTEAV